MARRHRWWSSTPEHEIDMRWWRVGLQVAWAFTTVGLFALVPSVGRALTLCAGTLGLVQAGLHATHRKATPMTRRLAAVLRLYAAILVVAGLLARSHPEWTGVIALAAVLAIHRLVARSLGGRSSVDPEVFS